MMNPPSSPPTDIVELLINTPPEKLNNICRSSARVNEVCKNINFWKALIRKDFPWVDDPGIIVPKVFPPLQLYSHLRKYYFGSTYDQSLLLSLIINGKDLTSFITSHIPTNIQKLNTFRDVVIRTVYEGQNSGCVIGFDDRDLRVMRTWFKLEKKEFGSDNPKSPPTVEYYPEGVQYILPDNVLNNFVISMYLSMLYHSGKSINFLDIHLLDYFVEEKNEQQGANIERAVNIWGYISSESVHSRMIDFLNLGPTTLINLSREIPTNHTAIEDIILLQVLNAVLAYRRYYAMEDILDIEGIGVFIKKVEPDDYWHGERINTANFWAYRVGTTMLYFRPCGFIVKVASFNGNGVKLSWPQITQGPIVVTIGKKIEDVEVLEQWGNITRDGSIYSRKINEFINKKNQLHVNINLMLQSPYFFGEFMHPQGLTSNSKVIVLGEI